MQRFIRILFCLMLLSCDVDTNVSYRSGTIDDDYMEGNVPKKYEHVLSVTNIIIDALKNGNFELIAKNYVADDVKDAVNSSSLASMMSATNNSYGEILSYKENQWGFVPDKLNDIEVIHSIKIVENRDEKLHYIFVFPVRTGYPKIIGFQIKVRNGVRAAGEI